MSEKRKTIMLIDDDNVFLEINSGILENKYIVYPVASGEQALKLLQKIAPDLILLDVEMPEMNGYEIIKRLKQDEKTKDIPVIFLTVHSDHGNELEGLSMGAVDYITKPFSPPLLFQRVENHLLLSSQKKELSRFNYSLQIIVEEQAMEIKKFQNALLSAMAEVVEFRDDMSDGHVDRVSKYIKTMINIMMKHGIYKEEIDDWDKEIIILASQIHDVGKIYVKEAILNKPGKINNEEFNEIKKHAAYGLIILNKIRQITGPHLFLDYAETFAGSHHERWNGTGYPEGLSGSDIPLAGRIMAIADVYDALISIRPYKQPMSPAKAAEEIIKGSGIQFDPSLVEVFKFATDEFAGIAERHDVIL